MERRRELRREREGMSPRHSGPSSERRSLDDIQNSVQTDQKARDVGYSISEANLEVYKTLGHHSHGPDRGLGARTPRAVWSWCPC